jgi:catechol 2,3-dioxygenase-like lactoylglutathione lyase family enzyme
MEWSKLVPELTVSDFGASLEFYTQVLGFNLAFSRSNAHGEPVFAYLDFNGIQLMLEAAPSSWPVADLARPYGRGINLQLEWPDVTQLRGKLVRLSYPLYRDIEETWRDTGGCLSGAREFLVQDPDGYLLRFSQGLGTMPLSIFAL